MTTYPRQNNIRLDSNISLASDEEFYVSVRNSTPMRFQNATFDTLTPAQQTLVESICKSKHRGLFLSGLVGSGKTHILYAIQLELAKLGKTSALLQTHTLIREIQNSMFDRPAEFTLKDVMLYKHCLLLDDFGTHKNSEATTSLLLEILNYRYEHALQTCFSSNFDLAELLKCGLDERICSRIAGMCEIRPLDHNDRRLAV